jgi:tetratricopeptide (TPR) repeat protein
MGNYLNNRKTIFFTLSLVILTLLYSSTLHAPFNFDDEVVIKHETSNAFGTYKLGKKDGFTRIYPLQYRHLFYSSLIFNYSLGELRPFGYHLVNTSLHFLTSIVIFFIAFITIKNGLSLNKKDALLIASITALFFSFNPVHSETVIYISARAVGMSSFFYLSAFLSFILGNLCEQKPLSRFLLYFLSLTCFFASILSKETALTFPIILLLYDVCFMRRSCWVPLKNRFLFYYLPLFSCGIFAIWNVLSLKSMTIHWWERIDVEYGLKQIHIIGHAVRLILFPIGLTFDYDFPNIFFTTNTLFTPAFLIALGIILIFLLFFPKTRSMISFCTLWFLITLAPTNSIIPRSDFLSERNLYLPSFGIIFLIAFAINRFVLARRNSLMVKRIGTCSIVMFFFLQVILLHERNLIYRSNTILWEDILKKSPGKLRALHNLSHFYMAEKNYAKAFTTLQALIKSEASPHYISYAHSNLGSIYLQTGDYLNAKKQFKFGINIKPSLPTNHFNLGSLLALQGLNLKAKESYEKAEDLYKNYRWGYLIPAELYINKARLLLKLGLYDEAESAIKNYLKRAPSSGSGHFIQAKIYSATGRLNQALHEYDQVGNEPRLKGEAHNNKALIFIKKKYFNRALKELNQAISITPNLIDAHYNLGNLLIQTNGDLVKSRWHFKRALELTTSDASSNRIKSALSSLP